MHEISHSEKILAQKTVCVLFVRGEDAAGRPIYAYVGVRADRLQDFIQAQQRGLFNPEDFGVVIEAGHGEPTPQVRTRMERDYGFNHDGMLDIPNSGHANAALGMLNKNHDPSGSDS